MVGVGVVLLSQGDEDMFQHTGLHDSPADPAYGDVQCVFFIFFWSHQTITSEGTQQHGQEQIQDLKQDKKHI